MCERQGHDLFYLDNTRQVRGVLQGHTKQGGIVVEQIGRNSGSYFLSEVGGSNLIYKKVHSHTHKRNIRKTM